MKYLKSISKPRLEINGEFFTDGHLDISKLDPKAIMAPNVRVEFDYEMHVRRIYMDDILIREEFL